jgi:hypothetical protein
VLRFDLARDVMHLHEHLQMLVFAAGLRFDEEAVHSGADWVARQVSGGQRRLSLALPRTVPLSLNELRPEHLAAKGDGQRGVAHVRCAQSAKRVQRTSG